MRLSQGGRNIAARVGKNWNEARQILAAARGQGEAMLPLLGRLCWLYGFRRFSMREIAGYDLLHGTSPMPAQTSKQESLKYLRQVNPPDHACLVENKIVFDAMCTARGLAAPRCHAMFVKGKRLSPTTVRDDTDADDVDWPDSFIVKPASGAYGRSVSAWRRDGAGWVKSSGERATSAELVRRFADESRSGALILQERVHAHPDIAALSGFDAVQTLRLVSVRDATNGSDASLLFGSLKLLGRDAVIDNFSFGHGGNLLCPIDIANGTITRALWRASPVDRLMSIERHPETGRTLPGFEIPCWDEVNDLVRRAADVFFLLPAIGWDIAITADGPMLIEGNASWDPSIASRDMWNRVRRLRA